jgi:fluoride ion exporter CrcB/FEX
MFAGSLLLGLTLIAFAAWLQWNDAVSWRDEMMESRLDIEYHLRRSKSRSRIHAVIGFCGALIMFAAFAGKASPLWVAAWLSVMAALIVIILLALLDAWRTYRYQIAKRPEIHRKNFGD